MSGRRSRWIAAAALAAMSVVNANAQNVPGVTTHSSPAEIAGRVTDRSTGEALADVRVTADTGDEVFGAITNTDGFYVLKNVTAGVVSVAVQKRAYIEINHSSTLQAGKSTTLDFTLAPATRIRGTVMDADTKKGVPGIMIIPLREDFGMGIRRFVRSTSENATTNASGEYELGSLAPGTYILEMQPSMNEQIRPEAGGEGERPPQYGRCYFPDVARMDSARPITVAQGEQHLVNFQLRKTPLLRVSGTLEFAEPVHGPVELLLTKRFAGSTVRIASADLKEGKTFRIENLADDEYTLTATAGAGAQRMTSQVILSPAGRDMDRVRIFLEKGLDVPGSTKQLDTEAALPVNLSVQLLSESDLSVASAPGKVAKDGSFFLSNLPRGRYFVKLAGLPRGIGTTAIQLGGQNYLHSAVPLDGSVPVGQLEFVLSSKLGSLSGRVEDRNSRPVPGVRVLLVPERTVAPVDPFSIPRASSDARGVFAMGDVPPGDYKAILLTGDERNSGNDWRMIQQKLSAAEKVIIFPAAAAQMTLRVRE